MYLNYTRFDEELKKAVMLNTRGSQQMLLLGRECKKLEVILMFDFDIKNIFVVGFKIV